MQADTTIQNPAFQTVPGDPLRVQQYTLRNGLHLFLSVNRNEPRVFTNIVVRSGSKQDPADTTGLAHYMEHMLFKGTSRIGALDWEREAQLLEKIAELYEQHRQTTDPEERRRIYGEIDRCSFEAAQLVAPSEYDKLLSTIGAKDTNAYTWVDQTVYVNDVPSNELERWMRLESERFRMMALRLFHTELETVYEEFNIGQDQDFRKVNRAVREALFPHHPYGTQPTIGKAEHLKAPSHREIQQYFQTYYVPNNMGIVLCGDFEPPQAVALAEQYFGSYQPAALPPFLPAETVPLTSPKQVEVYGQQPAFVDLAWRLGGGRTDDAMMVQLLKQMLYNQQAGLLDLNLNQRQRVLYAQAWAWTYQDYSVLGLYAKPREGQSLEAAGQLLLGEVQRLRDGAFDEWLIEAAIKDLKHTAVKASEENRSRADVITKAFVLGMGWERMAGRFQWWEQVSKSDIVQFAQQKLGDNYVQVFKHLGDDPRVKKVEKPPITPIELQRNAQSEYARSFLTQSPDLLHPVFADFKAGIQQVNLQPGLSFDYVHNPNNELFRLDYIVEVGKLHDPWLPVAVRYLPYLGTKRYSAAELQREFFRLGLSFSLHCGDRRVYLTLSGLDESLPEGIRLMEHLLEAVQPEQEPLQRIVADILTRRANAKQDRSHILRHAMANYARYGKQSPYQYRVPETELRAVDAQLLLKKLKNLLHLEHTVHYYGPRQQTDVQPLLEQYHRCPDELEPLPQRAQFEQLPTTTDEVLTVDFPMVQTDVMLLSRGTPRFSLEEHLMAELFNEYFGFGLSSIVFQEIREAKALAYSTFAYYSSPSFQDQAHYFQAYLGTQPDKVPDGVSALQNIIHRMPLSEKQLEQARQSILRRIESSRIPPNRLYWEYKAAKQLGFEHDLQADLYPLMQKTMAKDLMAFQEQYVKGRHFKYLILGQQQDLDQHFLEDLGPVRQLSLEEVFGF